MTKALPCILIIYNDQEVLDTLKSIKKKPVTTLDAMLAKGLNSPVVSSAGRLFDAVAAAVGICLEQVQYEGQAAIELEALITPSFLEQQKG